MLKIVGVNVIDFVMYVIDSTKFDSWHGINVVTKYTIIY